MHYMHAICQHFDIGELQAPPEKIHGGRLHKMWRIKTTKNIYALKQ